MTNFIYQKDFEALINFCRSNFNDDKFIIGSGNPNSNIMFVGQEPSGDANDTNTLEHFENLIKNSQTDLWIRKREHERTYCETTGQIEPSYWHCHSALWHRYQELYDLILYGHSRPHNEEMDFEASVFCSEMNGKYSKRHANADTHTLAQRKKSFFSHPFFNRFKVIVLACGHCIENIPEKWEINEIFKVKIGPQNENPPLGAPIRDNFWVHYNEDRSRIVIHTTNLSGPLISSLVPGIAHTIRTFLLEKYPNLIKE